MTSGAAGRVARKGAAQPRISVAGFRTPVTWDKCDTERDMATDRDGHGLSPVARSDRW